MCVKRAIAFFPCRFKVDRGCCPRFFVDGVGLRVSYRVSAWLAATVRLRFCWSRAFFFLLLFLMTARMQKKRTSASLGHDDRRCDGGKCIWRFFALRCCYCFLFCVMVGSCGRRVSLLLLLPFAAYFLPMWCDGMRFAVFFWVDCWDVRSLLRCSCCDAMLLFIKGYSRFAHTAEETAVWWSCGDVLFSHETFGRSFRDYVTCGEIEFFRDVGTFFGVFILGVW